MFTAFSREEPEDLARRLERVQLPVTVYDLLSVTALRHAQKPAWYFIDTGVSRTWAEVKSLVDRAAAAFHRIGIGAGAHVAVMAWNIEEFPVTWLALARLGAVLVPVNARYTATEVSYVLETSAARHLLIQDQLTDRLRDVRRPNIPDRHVVVIGAPQAPFSSWEQIHAAATGEAPVASADPERLLNLQYTSGTTGFSKACMLPHRYWILIGLTSLEMFGTRIDRFYASSSFYYMVPQRILMNAMFAGGCIYFPSRPSAKRFMIDVGRFDCEYCLPFQSILKEPARVEDRAHRVKLATSGIASLTTGEHSAFHERFGFLVQNYYGMTEIGSGTYVPAHHVQQRADTGTIGVPTPFREVAIFDHDGTPLPAGSEGEICVKGPGMLRGYFGNEAATTDAFRNGWFRTGDLGRRGTDGYFHIVGRLKDMVRRGAENIAAREVESVLRMMPEVLEAAVVPVPDSVTGEEVKAYIQLRPGMSSDTATPERILDHCARHLAPFKVPRYLAYVAEFPLTDSNRVQKRKLTAGALDLRDGAYDRFLGRPR